jgi:hypothetical protein
MYNEEFNPLFMMAAIEELQRAGLVATFKPKFDERYQAKVMVTWTDPLEMLIFGAFVC